MFATLLLPNFYLQAITRHQPALRQQPLAVLDTAARKAMIVQLNKEAISQGVRPGMTPSQALGRCLHLVIKVRAREREQQLRDIVLHHAFTLSPLVEATAPDTCIIQFLGTANFATKVEEVIQSLARCDVVARGGIANSLDASVFAAHLAEPLLQVSDIEYFLAPLPIETLAIDSIGQIASPPYPPA